MSKCSQCRGVYDCSTICSIAHWALHKKSCKLAKGFHDLNEVHAIRTALDRDNVSGLLNNVCSQEFNLALCSRDAYNLFSAEGRRAKIYLTHVVVLEYVFDPHPIELRHCYTITSGRLEEKVALVTSLGPENAAKNRFALSTEGRRITADERVRQLGRDGESGGIEVIPVAVAFQKGSNVTISGYRLILPSVGRDRPGEDEYIDGLNQGLRLPRERPGFTLNILHLTVRLTARDNMRVQLAKKEGRTSKSMGSFCVSRNDVYLTLIIHSLNCSLCFGTSSEVATFPVFDTAQPSSVTRISPHFPSKSTESKHIILPRP
jgi:hypothetical protein